MQDNKEIKIIRRKNPIGEECYKRKRNPIEEGAQKIEEQKVNCSIR